jgi:hypothetical protein
MRKAEYERFIREASREALAKAIKRLAILSQTKVYLVWKRREENGRPTKRVPSRNASERGGP